MKTSHLLSALAALCCVPNQVPALDKGAPQGTPAGRRVAESAPEAGTRAERRRHDGRRWRAQRGHALPRLPAERRQAALELLESARQTADPLRQELHDLRAEARLRSAAAGTDAASRAALRAQLRTRALEARRRHAPALAEHGRRLLELLPLEVRARLEAAGRAKAEGQGLVWNDTLLHERIGLRLGLGRWNPRHAGLAPGTSRGR